MKYNNSIPNKLLVVVAIFTFAAGSSLGYYIAQFDDLIIAPTPEEQYNIKRISTTPFSEDLKYWETYTNAQYGFSISHPRDYQVTYPRHNDFEASILMRNNKEEVHIGISKKNTTKGIVAGIPYESFIYAGEKKTIKIGNIETTAYHFPQGWECYGNEANTDCSAFYVPIKQGNYYYLISARGNAQTIGSTYTTILASLTFAQ